MKPLHRELSMPSEMAPGFPTVDTTENAILVDSANLTANELPPDNASGVIAAGMLVVFGSMLLILIAARKIRQARLTQYTVHMKSCFVSYGTFNAQDIWPIRVQRVNQKGVVKSLNRFKGSTWLVPGFHSGKQQKLRMTRFTSVSDKWKAKFQKSNNFFIINIIPEEPEDDARVDFD